MNLNQWLPIVGPIIINAFLLMFYFGKTSAEMKAMKVQLDSLLLDRRDSDRGDGALGIQMKEFAVTKAMTDCHHARIAGIESRLTDISSKIDWGTRRFDELFRGQAALARGDKPTVLPVGG